MPSPEPETKDADSSKLDPTASHYFHQTTAVSHQDSLRLGLSASTPASPTVSSWPSSQSDPFKLYVNHVTAIGLKPSSESPLHSAKGRALTHSGLLHSTTPSRPPAPLPGLLSSLHAPNPPHWPPYQPSIIQACSHLTASAGSPVSSAETRPPAHYLINSLTFSQSSLKCRFLNEAHLTAPLKTATSHQSSGPPSSCASCFSPITLNTCWRAL